MKLYDYFRSSASYRVRIALHLKKISYEKISVHLVHQGGEQHHPDYLKLNPQGLVPILKEEEQIISQSLAILEYLEEIKPSPPLLPSTPLERAQVRSMALMIACDIHPLNNLRVLNWLRMDLNATDQKINDWYHHWLKKGFEAFERRLQTLSGTKKFCVGNEISLADVCLVPQVYNAHRFNFLMKDYPLINEIYDHCLTLKPFQETSPDNYPP